LNPPLHKGFAIGYEKCPDFLDGVFEKEPAWWQTGTDPAGQGADWVDLRGFLLGVFEKEHGSR
jgi:hypothetical protein